MTVNESTREHRLRRKLARHDMRLAKTPARSWLRREYGPGYMVSDDHNTLVMGCFHRAYDATLEQVESWAAGL